MKAILTMLTTSMIEIKRAAGYQTRITASIESQLELASERRRSPRGVLNNQVLILVQSKATETVAMTANAT